jgi:hypothetical protein
METSSLKQPKRACGPSSNPTYSLRRRSTSTRPQPSNSRKLPGIYPTKAKAIIDYRAQHALFTALADLENVPGIGPVTLAQSSHLLRRVHKMSIGVNAIFEIASSVATPLGLGGFFAAATFYIFRQIIAKDIFPKFGSATARHVLSLIIERLFILALVAMILGFVAFLVTRLLPPQPVPLVDLCPEQGCVDIHRVADFSRSKCAEDGSRTDVAVFTDTFTLIDTKSISILLAPIRSGGNAGD